MEDKEAYAKRHPNPGHLNYIEFEYPKRLEWTADECHKEALEYYPSDDINADGSTNETCNPVGNWDWYEVGGRWAAKLILKEGADLSKAGEPNFSSRWSKERLEEMAGRYDSALLKDIDFDRMVVEAQGKNEFLWDEFNTKVAENPSEKTRLEYNYGRNGNPTKEEYVTGGTSFSTFAVLKDGKWLEKGKMLMFGVSVDEDASWGSDFMRLLEDVDGDTLITVVDCHT